MNLFAITVATLSFISLSGAQAQEAPECLMNSQVVVNAGSAATGVPFTAEEAKIASKRGYDLVSENAEYQFKNYGDANSSEKTRFELVSLDSGEVLWSDEISGKDDSDEIADKVESLESRIRDLNGQLASGPTFLERLHFLAEIAITQDKLDLARAQKPKMRTAQERAIAMIGKCGSYQ